MARVSATILNWNEWEISLPSVVRLLADPLINDVVVIDSSSVDESDVAFKSIADARFTYKRLDRNYGYSVGKNRGIALCDPKTEYVFLLNGDIQYVPGTIEVYSDILDTYKEAATVGYNDYAIQQTLYKRGIHVESISPFMAHQYTDKDGMLVDGFPAVIPCYGLFRHEALKKHPFTEEGPFGDYGGSFEDDWMWREFIEDGYKCLTYTRPFVYHCRGLSVRFLDEKERREVRNEEARKELFNNRWGLSSSELLERGLAQMVQIPVP